MACQESSKIVQYEIGHVMMHAGHMHNQPATTYGSAWSGLMILMGKKGHVR